MYYLRCEKAHLARLWQRHQNERDLLRVAAIPFGNLGYGGDYHGRQFSFKFLHLSRLYQYNLIVFSSQAFPIPDKILLVGCQKSKQNIFVKWRKIYS